MSTKSSMVLVLFVALSSDGRAGPVTFQFSGQITNFHDENNLLGGQVTVGSPFSGEFTFESSTPDSHSNPFRGEYINAILSISGGVAGLPFSGPLDGLNHIGVDDGIVGPTIDFIHYQSMVRFADYDLHWGIGVLDDTGVALTSDVLPVDAFNLEDFEFKTFSISDTTEQLSLAVSGELHTLVPEPATLLLLLTGATFCLRRRVRKSFVESTKKTGDAAARLLSVVVLILFISTDRTFAADCNQNGIDDSLEVPATCKVDVLFLFDTSDSITTEDMSNLCTSAGSVVTALSQAGADVHAEKLRITGGTPWTQCTCCGGANVPATYGTSTSGLPETLNCTGSGQEEDWAPATAVVAGNRNWRAGAVRVIVPISDEAPRCGDPLNDPGDDRNAVTNALSIVTAKNVIVIPLVELGTPAVPLADDLATGRNLCGTSGGYVLTFGQANLVPEIARIILMHCPDCNDNGIPDECDLATGGAQDCHGHPQNNCCTVHSWPGCSDPLTQQLVCGQIPACCSGPWNINCVNAAENQIGCPVFVPPTDCVIDECQASRDCNNNGILDDCDVSCGADGGSCDVPGCGQLGDCEGDCIPDVCQGYPDCNLNGLPDLCDISTGASCDENNDAIPDECVACCVEVPDEAPVCSNLIPADCPSGGTVYSGLTCSDCTCDLVACCSGSSCCEIAGCACIRKKGQVTGSVCQSGACPNASCCTGSCCLPNGQCKDEVGQVSFMTKTDCDGLFGTYAGGKRCKGCICAGNTFISCSTNVDCGANSPCINPGIGGGACSAQNSQQPSPCLETCPLGEINKAGSTPPDMPGAGTIVDARYPHPPNNPGDKLGIGDPNGTADDRIQIKLLNGTTPVLGADLVKCWCLCETAQDASFGPNSITCVEELGNGMYEIHLARPITTRAATTISYKRSSGYMTYIAHPANVNGNSSAGPSDILTLIDHLNGVLNPPLTKWQCDIDHSTACVPADILGEVDMLNGANGFAVANGTAKPAVLPCPAMCSSNQVACASGGGSGGGGGGGGHGGGLECPQSPCGDEDDPMEMAMAPAEGLTEVSDANQQFADYVVSFLRTYDGNGELDEAGLEEVVGAIGQWCLVNFSASEREALAAELNETTFASAAGSQSALELISVLNP